MKGVKMVNFTALTSGCLSAIMADRYEGEEPVLQVLGSKKVRGAGGEERYRLLLSDGQYLQSFAMLSPNLNELVSSGSLSEHTIIRVKDHITPALSRSTGPAKRVLIIVNLEILHKGTQVGMKIGDPNEVAAVNSDAIRTHSVNMQSRIAQLEAENKEQRAEIEAKNAKIAEQGAKIAELVSKIAEHGVKIEKLETLIAEVLQTMPV